MGLEMEFFIIAALAYAFGLITGMGIQATQNQQPRNNDS